MEDKLNHADKASQQLAACAGEAHIEIVWDRYEAMQPQCGFGLLGICCRICSMGPCRIDPYGSGPARGVCGADIDTIAARNLVRMIAGGAAAHSDHGRDIAHSLLLAAQNEDSDYQVKDEEKLKSLARVLGIDSNGDISQLAAEVASACLNDFGRQDDKGLAVLSMAPEKRRKIWQNLHVTPRSVDREIVEIMHRTHMGVDTDYKNIIKQGIRCALSDGWGGSLIATELSDILFGTPSPLRSEANLGVLSKEDVNIIVHGHEPTLSDIIAVVSQDKELKELAKAKGAAGISVAGICCTANEILMRHGIPVAGNFLQQELALMTGAVELMVVDVQCLMPGLNSVAGCFHTKLITTSPKAKIRGVEHIEFHEEKAVQIAKQIITMAINNFHERVKEKVIIPDHKEKLVAGFSSESVYAVLGGKYRATYRPLNDAVMSGRLRGAAGVVGCCNPNMPYEEAHIKMVKELIKNDVLVVTTGCNAIACAKHGLLKPEAAYQYAGRGLREVCNAVGIPPVLHVGSCVDNSRILIILSNIVSEGGLGEDIADLPVAGAAPEWMSEKAVSIGFYFVASGVYTVLGKPLPVMGSKNLHTYLTEEIEAEIGGKWEFEEDPVLAARKMITHIDKKRKALKLKPCMYEQEKSGEK
ncbi:MAG: anaerobic carbon-monoxide dehydrogenase catalytic subunit [Spirochaetales bacterium]|nr:anaerobic carbon-monoxide dehydrogenase catalytic subunit [Spirochaetales bacterium]